MKKIYDLITISIFVLFGHGAMQAQSFNAGLIAGATFCQVDGDNYAGFHQLGFTTGAFVNLPFDDFFSAQMELKYSLLGAHSSDKEVNEYYYPPFNLRLHYAEVPLMLRYNLGAFRLDFLTLEAGVSADIRVRATEDVDGDYQITTSRWNVFSMTANGGAHFAINEHFGLGARFMYSILPIRINPEVPSYFYGHYYNKVVQFTLTYTFNAPR